MRLFSGGRETDGRRIVTLDVLKFKQRSCLGRIQERRIVTLDVLKLQPTVSSRMFWSSRIVTLDVLKSSRLRVITGNGSVE